MKKTKKKGGKQNDQIDFDTKMNIPLAVSAVLFFGVVTTFVVQSNIVQTGNELQNSASVAQILPHAVATTTEEVVQP